MKKIPDGIKNIIFDLGGVLIDIDANRTIEAFRVLGLPDLIKPGGWGYHHAVFLDMEKGLLSNEEFRDGIRALLPNPVSDEDIDRAWCAIMIDFPEERIELLHKLRSRYNIYLFSNTNAIHIDHFRALFKKKFGYPMSDLFVMEYFSNEMKLRKPALESYLYVLNDAEISPAETLFIDDLDKNSEGARQAGMYAVWLSPETDLNSIFEN